MSRLIIKGGRKLEGSIAVDGAKNSALPIVAAAALAAEGESVIDNVPHSRDILDLCQIMRELGVQLDFADNTTVRVKAQGFSEHVAPYRMARKLRGSIYVVGLLLARLGRAEVAFPGGCAIGSRPVDFHLKGFEALGARMAVEHGCIVGEAGRLKGARIYIERASFGTTLNMMISACLAEGTTVLENAALEPEVVDLANFLNRMGARVRGAGTNLIRVDGVERLTGTRHEVIPDRLQAGTYLLAGAITGGAVRVESVIPEHLHAVMAKLAQAGCVVEEEADHVTIFAPRRPRPTDVETQPHPGFPTDLQSPFTALLCLAEGVSVVHETIFENRFGYANELTRMGANVKVDRDTAIIRGVPLLTGAPVEATDIRGGIALVLAGLRAEGETEVNGLEIIDRGYHLIEEKLGFLGANIKRIED